MIFIAAKFGCNRISRFENIKSLNILHVWPENAYSRPFLGYFGVKIGENGQFLNSYPSRNAITRN